MKKIYKQLFTVSLLCCVSLAQAQLKTNDITTANTLFADYACTSCHDFSSKLVGPSLQEIAQRYKGKNATVKIAHVIRLGGQGKWGELAHPANEGIEKQNATLLAKWILSGAPQQ
jgi:cytochrome c551/c552